MEWHINTMILVARGNEIACQGACFNIPLRIDTETFQIDVLLLDISVNVVIILGMSWMADLGNIHWNFASLEMQFQQGRVHRHFHKRPQPPTTKNNIACKQLVF